MSLVEKLIVVALFLLGILVAYVLGMRHNFHTQGYIDISDSDDDSHQGKVTFVFNDEIEQLIRHDYVMLKVNNKLTIKNYNHNNEETKK